LAYKPGSVVVQSFIWDVRHQTPQATYPRAITGYHYSSIWSCSRWGLQCPNCCQSSGALLPHLFTLTL